MLRSLKDLERYTVEATDGDVGRIVDFLMDDKQWVVRYLVVETGSFFKQKEVLISPISFRDPDWETRHFNLALTKAKVQGSPDVDLHKPVSRQHEQAFYQYYGYPDYWGDFGLWGVSDVPFLMQNALREEKRAEAKLPPGDVHLRSANEVRGYHVHGSDKDVGHVQDFIVDDQTWALSYLVVNTSEWWLGNQVLIAPHWASRVSWTQREVHVDLSRQKVKDSPPWDGSAGVNREYETRLYDYYGRPKRWETVPNVPRTSAPVTVPANR
jgi:sporulation protein YlmC with PRC-barrel domain